MGKNGLFICPKTSSSLNKHIFIKAKGCAYYEKSAYYKWAQFLEVVLQNNLFSILAYDSYFYKIERFILYESYNIYYIYFLKTFYTFKIRGLVIRISNNKTVLNF